jgi:hypothetical protein
MDSDEMNSERLEVNLSFRDDREERSFKPSRLSFQISQASRGSTSIELQSNPQISPLEQHAPLRISKKLFFLLAFKSVGVIFGDIGTSPLYTITILDFFLNSYSINS